MSHVSGLNGNYTQHVVCYLKKDFSNDTVLFEKSRGRFPLVRLDGNAGGVFEAVRFSLCCNGAGCAATRVEAETR